MNIRQVAKNADREATEHLAAIERDLVYVAALALVNQLDPDPVHDSYWRVGGERCDTLDQVVRKLEQYEIHQKGDYDVKRK